MSQVPNRNQTVVSASGAVAPGDGLYHITKAGVAAITLVDPTVDGQRMVFIDEGGHAHTIVVTPDSPPTVGLNGGVVSTITFNGTAGSAVELISRNGSWWTGARTGVALT